MDDNHGITVRKMRESDLSSVLTWRNDTTVRRFMLTQHQITEREHRAWFDRAYADSSYALLIMVKHDKPLGCVTFSGAQAQSTADWSFYTNPLSPPGTGKRICTLALQYAFEELCVHKVTGRVLDFNHASIRIHQRLGFIQEGTLRKHFLVDKTYCDLLCFGILSTEWIGIS